MHAANFNPGQVQVVTYIIVPIPREFRVDERAEWARYRVLPEGALKLVDRGSDLAAMTCRQVGMMVY